jgi:hypothetical protein
MQPLPDKQAPDVKCRARGGESMKRLLIGVAIGFVLTAAVATYTFYNFKVDADGNYVYIQVFGQIHEFNYGKPLVQHP